MLSMDRGAPAFQATAARQSMGLPSESAGREYRVLGEDMGVEDEELLNARPEVERADETARPDSK